MVYYITDCGDYGCEVEKSGLKRFNYVSERGTKTSKLVCKEHGGVIINRKTRCGVCNKPVIVGLRGNCADKCEEHTVEAQRKRMREIKRIEGNPYQSNKVYPIDNYPRIDKYIPEASVWAFNACYGKGIIGTKDDIEKTQEWSDYFLRAMDRILSQKGLRVL